MLSYRHAFHAGNHADVLKHWVLLQCLQYMKQKDKPMLFLDTHAGAGMYSLAGQYAQKTGEYRQGIGRLWHCASAPETLSAYLAVVRDYNPDELAIYPGSTAIASKLLRTTDQLFAAELNPADRESLATCVPRRPGWRVLGEDGLRQLKALLPPASRRGLVLIDPPYEQAEEYARVIQALQQGLKRFATGTYLVWYPLLNSPQSRRFPGQLHTATAGPWLDVSLQVKAPGEGYGMYGSGMFVINPPYTLYQQLQQGLPWLLEQLASDEQADYHVALSDPS